MGTLRHFALSPKSVLPHDILNQRAGLVERNAFQQLGDIVAVGVVLNPRHLVDINIVGQRPQRLGDNGGDFAEAVLGKRDGDRI